MMSFRNVWLGGVVGVLFATACASGAAPNTSAPTSGAPGFTSTSVGPSPVTASLATVASVAASPGAASAAPNTPAPKPLAAPTDVHITQVNPAEYLSPLYLAIAFGEFQKENLNVTLDRIDLSNALVQMRQGNVQMEAAGLSGGLLNAISQTDGFRQVGASYNLWPDSHEGIWIKNDFFDASGNLITAKIKGMRLNIGQGGVAHSNAGAIARFLQDQGGYTVKDIQVTELNSADLLIGMKQGSVDGGYVITPYWKQLEQDRSARLVPGTGYSLASYIMPTDFIKNKSDVAKAVLRALMRTQRTYLQGNYHSDPKVVTAIAQAINAPESTVTNGDPLNFTTDLMFAPSAVQTIQALQQVWLDAGNVLQYKDPISIDRINDLSLAKDVAAGN